MEGEELPGTVNVDKNREASSTLTLKGKILWKNSEMHMVKNKRLSSMAEDADYIQNEYLHCKNTIYYQHI